MPEHGTPFPDAAVAALERLGSMTLRNQSMDSVLQTVVDLAVTVLPGTPDSSITLLTRGRPVTVVSTGQLALDLDERQYEQGHGPCLHCASTGELTEVADARADPRWRDYLPAAVERGCLSSLSVPLQIDDRVSGALNVYAREPHAFDETGRRVALRFAPYAAVAVANMQAYQDARDMADNLHAALESRAVIDQAKGILMERFKLTADQAFQALAEVSMRTNTKAQLVAQQLVRTGEFDVRVLRRR